MGYRLMSPGFRAGITRAARSPGSILTDGRSLRSSESIYRSLLRGASGVEYSPARLRPFRKVCQYCRVVDRTLGITSRSDKKKCRRDYENLFTVIRRDLSSNALGCCANAGPVLQA